jgi:hypothetical protein
LMVAHCRRGVEGAAMAARRMSAPPSGLVAGPLPAERVGSEFARPQSGGAGDSVSQVVSPKFTTT